MEIYGLGAEGKNSSTAYRSLSNSQPLVAGKQTIDLKGPVIVNLYFLVSGCLAILLGVIHSVLGEILIFRHLRESDLFSDNGTSKLRRRHYKTLWSTWHLVTLLGWGIGAVLFALSWANPPDITLNTVALILSILFAGSAVYWLIGTKGKHPAWIVLGAISLLTWLANNA
jgi:hypothetical protein